LNVCQLCCASLGRHSCKLEETERLLRDVYQQPCTRKPGEKAPAEQPRIRPGGVKAPAPAPPRPPRTPPKPVLKRPRDALLVERHQCLNRAREYSDARNDYLRRAAQQYQARQGGVAAVYSKEAARLGEKMRAELARALELAVEHRHVHDGAHGCAASAC